MYKKTFLMVLLTMLFTLIWGFQGGFVLFITRCFFKWGNDALDLLFILLTSIICSGYLYNALIY